MDDNTHLHVSFDVDFLDPSIAPGVGTTVPGGPNYREAQLVMEMIADTGRMLSLDIVELNPHHRQPQPDRRAGGGPGGEPVRQVDADARLRSTTERGRSRSHGMNARNRQLVAKVAARGSTAAAIGNATHHQEEST